MGPIPNLLNNSKDLEVYKKEHLQAQQVKGFLFLFLKAGWFKCCFIFKMMDLLHVKLSEYQSSYGGISFSGANIVMLTEFSSFCPGCSLQTNVQPVEKDETRPSTKQRVKFDPTDWMDSVSEQPETQQPSR